MAKQLTLKDGTILDYYTSTPTTGFPLVWHHGNPGAFNPVPHLEEACQQKNFRLITYSRPGFGGSSRKHGRSVVDAAEDVRELAKLLDLEKFAVGGWSAGGPHALACAARLEDCVAVIAVASVAPHDGEGLVWPEGTSKDSSEEEIAAKYAKQRPGMLSATAAEMIEEIKPEIDQKALKEVPGLAQYVEDTFREALKTSADGCVDDDMAFFKPWGFGLEEVKVPVYSYHGEADLSVPFSHGEWIANQVDQRLVQRRFTKEDGHVSIMRDVDRMLDDLRAVVDGKHAE